MKIPVAAVVCGISIAIAGSAAWFAICDSSTDASRISGNAELQQQVKDLEHQLAQVSAHLDQRGETQPPQINIQWPPKQAQSLTARTSTDGESARAATDSRENLPKGTPEEASELKNQQHLERLEQAFQNQDEDFAWSAQATDSIGQYFDSHLGQMEGFGSELNNVSCGGSLCKVEVVHHDQAAAEAFALEFPQAIAENVPDINYDYKNLSDGSISVTMYLSRDVN